MPTLGQHCRSGRCISNPRIKQSCQETQRRTRDVPEVRSATRKEETRCAFWQQPRYFREAVHDHHRRARAAHELAVSSSTARHHNEVQARLHLQEEQTVSASSYSPCSRVATLQEIFRCGRRWGRFNCFSAWHFGRKDLQGQENHRQYAEAHQGFAVLLGRKGDLEEGQANVLRSSLHISCCVLNCSEHPSDRREADRASFDGYGAASPGGMQILGTRCRRSNIKLHVRHFPIKCTCDKLIPEWLTFHQASANLEEPMKHLSVRHQLVSS